MVGGISYSCNTQKKSLVFRSGEEKSVIVTDNQDCKTVHGWSLDEILSNPELFYQQHIMPRD